MIYKRQPQFHSLPSNTNKLDAENQYLLSDFKGLQVFDNPLIADLKSTYECKNVYVDETKTLTVRPAIHYVDANTNLKFIHTRTGTEYILSREKLIKQGTTIEITITAGSNVVFLDDYEQAYFLVQRNGSLTFLDSNLAKVSGDILLADSADDIDKFNILNSNIQINKYPFVSGDYTKSDAVKFDTTAFTLDSLTDGQLIVESSFQQNDLLALICYNNNDTESSSHELTLFDGSKYSQLSFTGYDFQDDIPFLVDLQKDISSTAMATIRIVTENQGYNTWTITNKILNVDGNITTKSLTVNKLQNTYNKQLLIPTSNESALVVGIEEITRLDIFSVTKEITMTGNITPDLVRSIEIDSISDNTKLKSNGTLVYLSTDSNVYDISGKQYEFGIHKMAIPLNIGMLGLNGSVVTLLQNSGKISTLDLSGHGITIGFMPHILFSDSQYIHIELSRNMTVLWEYTTNKYFLIQQGQSNNYILTPNYGFLKSYNSSDSKQYYYFRKYSKEFRDIVARKTDKIPVLSSIKEKPITGFYLDGFWWFITEHHIFGSGANGEGKLTIEYWDPYKYFEVSEVITGAMRISDTSFWVFHNNGAYLIYKATSPDDTGRYLWLSTPVAKFKGCDFENATAILPVSNYTCVVTDDDISIVQLRENVQSDDRVLVPMTTQLAALVSEVLNETKNVLIGTYKYLSLFFCNPQSVDAKSVPILVYDNAQYNWWYWEIPVKEVKQILPGFPLQIVTDKGTYEFTESYIENLYCDIVSSNTDRTQINWHWQSAVQLFGNLVNRKQLLQTIFTFCDVGENESNLDYKFIIYSKQNPDETTQTFTETLVYRIKNNTVRTLISSFTYLQIQLANATSASDMNMDKQSVMTRPKIVSMIFKFRNLQGGIT